MATPVSPIPSDPWKTALKWSSLFIATLVILLVVSWFLQMAFTDLSKRIWIICGVTAFILVGVLYLISVAPRQLAERQLNALTNLPTPSSASDLAKVENDVRTSLIGLIGGMAVLGGVAFTFWQFHANQIDTQKQLSLTTAQVQTSQQQAVSERFSRAVGAFAVRGTEVAGIYSMNRVGVDAPDYRLPIVDTLAAFVISRAPRKTDAEGSYIDQPPLATRLQARSPDVQAALTILGATSTNWKKSPSSLISLLGADLRNADFDNFSLRGGSQLKGLDLTGSRWTGATDLSGTRISNTLLIECSLINANLSGVTFHDVALDGADLTGADLSDAKFTEVVADQKTRWPSHFSYAAHHIVLHHS